VLYSSPVTPGQKSDLWFLPLTGDNRKPDGMRRHVVRKSYQIQKRAEEQQAEP